MKTKKLFILLSCLLGPLITCMDKNNTLPHKERAHSMPNLLPKQERKNHDTTHNSVSSNRPLRFSTRTTKENERFYSEALDQWKNKLDEQAILKQQGDSPTKIIDQKK